MRSYSFYRSIVGENVGNEADLLVVVLVLMLVLVLVMTLPLSAVMV